MLVLTSLLKKPDISSPVVFTFGTFDGVHLGHQYIFKQVQKVAKEVSAVTCALTFSNHPSHVLFPQSPTPQLTSNTQKVELMSSFFDYLINIPFTQSLRNQSAEEFLSSMHEALHFSHIVVGRDVRFGKDGRGDYRLLAESSEYSCTFLDRFCIDSIPVSSSHIRRLIQEGKLQDAHRFLGRPFSHYLPCKDNIVDLTGYVQPPNGRYAVKVKKDEGWKSSFVYLNGVQLTLEDVVDAPFVQIQYVDGPL